MAIATSFNVTATQGARESLANTLRFVEPTVTPLYSTLKQSAAPKAVLTEWLADVLANPDLAGTLDGVDLTFPGADFTDQINSRVRLGNRVQTVRNAYAVSRQAQMISVAPGESLTAASKAKSLLELKRSLETVIGSGASQRTGSGSVTALSQGLGVWSDPSAAVADVPASVLAVSGSRFDLSNSVGSAVMVESDLRALLQAVYEASGTKSDYRLFAGPSVVNEISDFSRANAGSSTFNQEVGGGRLSLSITEYNSSYGTLKIIPDLFLGREEGAAITGATNVSPIKITSAAHGFIVGDIVTISGVLGNTAANGTHKIGAVADVNSLTLVTTDANPPVGTNVVGNGAYTSGGILTAGNNTAQGVLNSRRAYLLPGDDTVSLKFLEGITSQDLPDLGAGPRAFVEAMITLCVTNPRALGSIV
jgi:hypothetical protein